MASDVRSDAAVAGGDPHVRGAAGGRVHVHRELLTHPVLRPEVRSGVAPDRHVESAVEPQDPRLGARPRVRVAVAHRRVRGQHPHPPGLGQRPRGGAVRGGGLGARVADTYPVVDRREVLRVLLAAIALDVEEDRSAARRASHEEAAVEDQRGLVRPDRRLRRERRDRGTRGAVDRHPLLRHDGLLVGGEALLRHDGLRLHTHHVVGVAARQILAREHHAHERDHREERAPHPVVRLHGIVAPLLQWHWRGRSRQLTRWCSCTCWAAIESSRCSVEPLPVEPEAVPPVCCPCGWGACWASPAAAA